MIGTIGIIEPTVAADFRLSEPFTSGPSAKAGGLDPSSNFRYFHLTFGSFSFGNFFV